MLKNELKKIFIKKGFICIVIALLLFEVVSCLISVNKIFQSSADKEKYVQWIHDFAGVVNEEKKKKIDDEYAVYLSANERLNTLQEELESGKIDVTEYNAGSDALMKYLSGKDLFAEFYHECEYAFSNTKERQIINTRIWKWLFGEEKIDIFYVFTIIICVLLSVVSEYESSFTDIKNTCQNGRKKLYRLDLTICYLYAGITSLLLCAVKYMIIIPYTGINDAVSSLQSLPLFENSRFDISLFQGYLMISLVKTIGGISFSALCIMVSHWSKTSLSVILFALFAAIIPPYVLSSPALYCIPPVSLLIANGYLFGDVVVSGDDVGGTIVYSTSVNPIALVICISIAFGCIVTSFMFYKKRLH